MEKLKYQNIIFFDELCPFCTKWVPYIIKHSKKNFYISPLSSKFAQRKLSLKHQANSINFESLIITNGEQVIKDGAAVKFVIKNLTGTISILKILMFLPNGSVNALYKLFAHNRTKIFGRYQSCPEDILDNEKFLYE